MTRETLLILLGALTALTPFLGLPYSWLMVLVPILGLSILGIGVTLRVKRSRATERDATPSYEAPEA